MRSLPGVGFCGMGIMGMPMARHVAEAGYPVTVYNRGKVRAEMARAFGATVAATPREAAEEARVLITMVTDAAAVQALMEGSDGFLAAANTDVLWIQMSTLDMGSTHSLAEAAKKKGWLFLDCPVAGSKKQVEAAQLILLAGGETGLLESVKPLLLKMGKHVVHAGGVGMGTALKLCLNLIVAQMTTALAESVALAEATGVDAAKIFEAIRQSPALDCGYFRIKEEAFLKKRFAPAFSLANMLKDVRFMTAEASQRELHLPITQAVQRLMEKALAQELGEQDVSSIYLALGESRDKK